MHRSRAHAAVERACTGCEAITMLSTQRSHGLRCSRNAPAAARQPHRSLAQRRVGRRQAALDGLPAEYGYVMGSVAVTAALLQWQAIRVALARRTAGVNYPKVYADGTDEVANQFNCTQRAHQNTLETMPAMIALVCLMGLKHPLLAAGAGMVWNVGRVIYTLGYSTGDPNKRLPGVAVSGLTYVGTIVACAYTGGQIAGLLP